MAFRRLAKDDKHAVPKEEFVFETPPAKRTKPAITSKQRRPRKLKSAR